MAQVREIERPANAWFLGDVALAQGDHPRARAHYVEALRLSSAESIVRCGALCGLARTALAEGDLAQAQGYAAEILRGLGAFDWTGFFPGLTPYLACYEILRASGDPRAQEMLEEAYRLLCARADAIDDPALRRSYLENVAANREIVATWEETSRP